MSAKDTEKTLRGILRRDGPYCVKCRKYLYPLTLDHIVPKREGGKDGIYNLQLLCLKCHIIKNNREGYSGSSNKNPRLKKIDHQVYSKERILLQLEKIKEQEYEKRYV